MLRQLLAEALRKVIEQFLANLAKQLGIPGTAAPLYDPTATDAAVQKTVDDLLN